MPHRDLSAVLSPNLSGKMQWRGSGHLTEFLLPTSAEDMPSSPTRANSGHIPALDGVRGVAAATVFVYHYGGGAQSSFLPLRVMGILLHFAWVGVSLFFVLSGFLISGILWDGYQTPGWWRRFYVRRSLRIFPLYYLALVIAAVIWLALGVPAVRLSFRWI